MRCFPIQPFSRAMVEAFHNHDKLLLSHGGKGPFLRQVLSYHAVGVFVASSLPGGIRIGEVGDGIQCLDDGTVIGELQPVVERQRGDTRLKRCQCFDDGFTDSHTGLARHMG